MLWRVAQLLSAGVIVGLIGLWSLGVGEDRVETEFFEQKIRPVLVQHCYQCHSHASGKMKGGLALDTRAGWKTGGKSGPAIVPGKPAESLLIQAVRFADGVSPMPPRGQLPPQVIADLETWVRRGAIDPRVELPKPGDALWSETVQQRRQWWSLQPVGEPAVPVVKGTAWPRQPLDHFVLKRLEQAGLRPAPAADRRTLARRLRFALHGLPPQVDEVEQFVHDQAPDAYEQLVDRWLAAPQFGERWARHWLDVVHYADTHGYEWDIPAKGAYHYRDYLVRAFNADVSFRQLILEHLAGDLLPNPRIEETLGLNESLLGTISLRLGERRHGDSAEFEGIHQESIDNVVDTVSKAFQATTVACAHCHDHKLDAISQRDYYALTGIFMSTRWVCRSAAARDPQPAQLAPLRHSKAEIKQQLVTAWREALTKLPARLLQPAADSPWAKSLADPKPRPESPAYIWSRLHPPTRPADNTPAKAAPANAVPVNVAPANAGLANADLAKVWAALAEEYAKLHRERQQYNRGNFRILADFTTGQLPPDWHAEGWGLRTGSVKHGELVIADSGDRAVRAILPAGLFTQVWTSRWGGALRSPLWLADYRGLACEVVGGEMGSRQLVVDNALFPESRYKLLDQPLPGWTTIPGMPDDIRKGRRIWLEFNTKEFNNYFPARKGFIGKYTDEQQQALRAWFGVTRVLVAPDASATPQDELQRFLPLLAQPAPESPDAAARAFATWCTAALQRWADNQADAEDVKLLTALLEFDLLPNRLEASPQLAAAVRQYRELEAKLPLEPVVGAVADYQEGRDERVGIRGSYTELGETIPRGYVEFLCGQHKFAMKGSGRWELAQVLADPSNPLTTRVFVNRVWHYLWGSGLVTSVDDFGHLGEQPSDPALLDHLALRFMREGWSLKRLVRSIVTSAAWQQSGTPAEGALTRDPDNRLWHHMPLRRLEAEALRDSLLAVSGRLDPQMYGPPVDPWRPAEDKDKRLVSGPLDGHGRRSLYIKMTLMEPPKFLALFNQPVPKLTMGRRDVTNVPDQALALLNDPFVLALAAHWAKRLVADPSTSVEQRITTMFAAALGRPPRDDELRRLQALVSQLARLHQVPEPERLTSVPLWTDVAHAVFNLKEFLYVR